MESLIFFLVGMMVLMHVQVRADDTDYVCLAQKEVTVDYSNKTAPFKVGDCMVPRDQSVMKDWNKEEQPVFALNENMGFAKNTFGIWQMDESCKGLKLVETKVVKPTGEAPKLKCPAGQVGVTKKDASKQHKAECSCKKFGEKWERSGDLCYPECRDSDGGYVGSGPVCWQRCPDHFTNVGTWCQKPKSYGRGGGYSSKDACKRHGGGKKRGCQKSGWLWYPKCRDSFDPVGCCVCSPKCKHGMTDIGADCVKKSYGRGVGKVPPGCAGTFVLHLIEEVVVGVVAAAFVFYTGGAAYAAYAGAGAVEEGGMVGFFSSSSMIDAGNWENVVRACRFSSIDL